MSALLVPLHPVCLLGRSGYADEEGCWLIRRGSRESGTRAAPITARKAGGESAIGC